MARFGSTPCHQCQCRDVQKFQMARVGSKLCHLMGVLTAGGTQASRVRAPSQTTSCTGTHDCVVRPATGLQLWLQECWLQAGQHLEQRRRNFGVESFMTSSSRTLTFGPQQWCTVLGHLTAAICYWKELQPSPTRVIDEASVTIPSQAFTDGATDKPLNEDDKLLNRHRNG